MSGKGLHARSGLRVPEALQPAPDMWLPEITPEVIDELRVERWSSIGIIAAFVDPNTGDVLMQSHAGGKKNKEGALGPLSETSRRSGPEIEQPLATLYRGIREELGVHNPAELDLMVHRTGGWVINRWPFGDEYPDQHILGISFPVFVQDPVTREFIESAPPVNEIVARRFMSPTAILETDASAFRAGARDWYLQLYHASLLMPRHFGGLQPVNFSAIQNNVLDDPSQDIRL